MIDARHVGVVAWLLTAWRENVVDQIPNMLQISAVGVLFFLLMWLYKIADKWMDFRIEQKRGEPVKTSADLSYNEQMARTIYDVNRTLSEVAVSNKQIVQMMERQTETQEKQTVLLDRLVRLLDNGKYHFETSGD